MKNKFKFLVKMSLDRKIKSKWFVIANVIIAIAIVCVANIDNIIKFFGGDFDSVTKLYVVDNINVYDTFENTFLENVKLSYDDDRYEVIKKENKDELIELIKTDEEKDSLILVLNSDEEDLLNAELISNDYIETLDSNIILGTLNNIKLYMAIDKYEISMDEYNALTSNVTINRQILDEEKDSAEENMAMIMSTIFPIFILPFFMLVLFLVQMIGAEVNDEKTTRGMEIIISNVSPTVHFFSKCVAGNLFILLQGLLLVIYVIIGLFSRGMFTGTGVAGMSSQLTSFITEFLGASFIDSLKYMLPLILVLMLLTFVAYSLLAGILASMTTNTEDFQQLQTPIMMLTLVGYYLGMTAGMFEGSIFIKILGYVPFISAILSPSLLVMGDFGIIDIIISMVIVIITIFLLIKYGLRIYKVGILNYSSNGIWKKMFKAIKQK